MFLLNWHIGLAIMTISLHYAPVGADVTEMMEQKTFLDLELQEFRHRLREVETDTLRLEAEISQIEASLQEQQPILKSQIRAIYKLNRSNQLGYLLSARSMSDFARRFQTLKRLLRYDIKRIEQWKRDLDRLNTYQKTLQNARETLEKLYRDIEWNLQALLLATEKKDQLIEVLEKDKERFRLLHETLASTDQPQMDHLISLLEEFNTSDHFSQPLRFVEAKGDLTWPVNGDMLSRFGSQKHPRLGTVMMNRGVDISTEKESPVIAAFSGRVILAQASSNTGYGSIVILDHGQRYYTLYSNLGIVYQMVGDFVEQGEKIGMTGIHPIYKVHACHFEIRFQGEAENPEDWLKPD